jgi:hypothetical protein
VNADQKRHLIGIYLYSLTFLRMLRYIDSTMLSVTRHTLLALPALQQPSLLLSRLALGELLLRPAR